MTRQTILEYFERHGGLSGSTEEEKMHCHYLDEGIVDSMGIVEMIAEFEEKLNVRFEAEHLQSEAFQTPAGIISIVEQLLKKAA